MTFNQELLQYLDGLYGYARALCRDASEAEDLVQETYLRAARGYAQNANDSNLKSWIHTIMRNIRLNQIRQMRNAPALLEIDGAQDCGPIWAESSAENPLPLYVEKLTRAEIREAVDQLPIHYREVIVLRDYQDLSYEQIARQLGCPTGTVMSRLGRAREKLRELLVDLGAPVFG